METSTCSRCGHPIQFHRRPDGGFWDHIGRSYRHPANPAKIFIPYHQVVIWSGDFHKQIPGEFYKQINDPIVFMVFGKCPFKNRSYKETALYIAENLPQILRMSQSTREIIENQRNYGVEWNWKDRSLLIRINDKNYQTVFVFDITKSHQVKLGE